jgi:hypothetical protein
MVADLGEWMPVIAEREAAVVKPTLAFPCRGEYNRYLGCIGARRCRNTGVTTCILGRWPEERSTSGAEESPSEAAPVRRQPVMPEKLRPPRPAASRPTGGAREGRPAPSGERGRTIIGILQPEPRLWQQLSRQVASAGFEPLWLQSRDAITQALSGDRPPAAILVGGRPSAGTETTGLFDDDGQQPVPVLNLPAFRDQASLQSAARMAVLWLTVTLRRSA